MLELGCLNGRRRRVISGRLITGGKRWGSTISRCRDGVVEEDA